MTQRVIRAATTIAVLSAAAKVVSVGKELLVARRFGTGAAIESYLVAFLTPALAVNVIATSLSIALIPTYIAVRETKGRDAAERLLSGLTAWTLTLLTLAAILIVVSSPLYLPLIASGFNQRKLDLAFQLLCVLSPIIVLNGLSAIWGAAINAGERFALVALTPVITPLTTIVVLLLFIRHSIFALPIGMLAGSALETTLLGAALKRRGISLRPHWYRLDESLRQVSGQFGPRAGASVLRSGSAVVDRSFAATLFPGAVAVLSYSQRITATLLSIAGVALGSAITPYLSAKAAKRDWLGLRQTLRNYLLAVTVASIPIVLLLLYFSVPIVRLIFERGSFRPRDTMLVAQTLSYYAFQIPFYLSNVFLSRLLGALMASRILIWGAAINLILNFVLNAVFIRTWGVAGIALATSCAAFLTFCFLTATAIRRLHEKDRVQSL
jgi:putative peptidoglycan lipid II flippase